MTTITTTTTGSAVALELRRGQQTVLRRWKHTGDVGYYRAFAPTTRPG